MKYYIGVILLCT